MTFNFSIPRPIAATLNVAVAPGEILFVLGANGSGKSSLMHHFYAANRTKARRIHAHRQTWFHTGLVEITPATRQQVTTQIQGYDGQPNARWMDQISGQRPQVAIYDLLNTENQLARAIAAAHYNNDLDLAQQRATEMPPLRVISELLRLSNIPIEVSVGPGERVVARKAGSGEFDIAQLSDGERNALLIAAEVLTAPAGSLFLIDEPERHLHRAITVPLLTQLFARRTDCAFIVSTHETSLPLAYPTAHTLLVRGCSYAGTNITGWEADLVSPDLGIDEDIKRDILGARSKILFVEGDERSLDKLLYSLLFPNASVIAKKSCRDVEHAVSGIRGSESLHWIHAFGIVDGDRRPQEELDELQAKGIYAVPFYSVESIYYHPEVQRRIAKRQESNGEIAAECLKNARIAALAAIKQKIQHLSSRVAEKEVREEFLKHLPRQKDVADGKPINVAIDVKAMVGVAQIRLEAAINSENIEMIIAGYPIREAQATGEIAKKLGYQNAPKYEKAVLRMLKDDPDAVEFARGLFGNLAAELDAH